MSLSPSLKKLIFYSTLCLFSLSLSSASISLKKLSTTLSDSMYFENEYGSIDLTRTSEAGTFKYLFVSVEFTLKAAENERIKLDKKNTFIIDKNKQVYTSTHMCFPNNVGRFSFRSLYQSYDHRDQKQTHYLNMAFKVPATETHFTLNLDKVKKKFTAKAIKVKSIKPITDYASFKLTKSKIITSIADRDYKGKIGNDSLYVNNVYRASTGNKLVAVTFAVSPKKYFDTFGTNKFVMPKFSIRDKTTLGELIGIEKNKKLEPARLDIYKQNKKWPRREITAIFSVPKQMKKFQLTAFGQAFLAGTVK
ncbi:MAG: hypothetical protein HRT88_10095 [Lentisphaeraceae bacterium]|nr:hypothetical protein [Lentisphaeraceae bacterium]